MNRKQKRILNIVLMVLGVVMLTVCLFAITIETNEEFNECVSEVEMTRPELTSQAVDEICEWLTYD